uniref:Uncharacterized protein n=1 Tax=uncultured bacterium fosmid pJB92C9 TaxID=1478074 RepID=A0A0H3U838_9BACT|nr:hypothetical protein [uncultured bacterium fosmid pJB92C9]
MRHFSAKMLLIAATALFFSCQKEQQEEKKDPQAPVIAAAALTGVNGETTVRAGAPVKFTADVTVQNSELDTYTIEIKKGDDVIGLAGGILSGASAKIEETIEVAVNPQTLEAEFTPTVYVKVTNKNDQYVEKTLDAASVCKICPPSLMDVYYMVDNNGACYELSKMADKGCYRSYVDLEGIGANITICEKVTGTGAVDPSGKTWAFETPTSEFGLKYIGFNAITEELFKMVNYTVTMNRLEMDKDCNKWNVYWEQVLVPDCEVVFLNFNDKMKLQSNRFANAVDNTARYIGDYGEKFECYYVDDTNWFIIKGQWSDNTVVWVTGEGASLPMDPYTDGHPLDWFKGNPDCAYSAVSCVRESESVYSALLYMKETFAIKLYDYWSWANELAWTSITPETIVISPMEEDPETGKVDGNYGNAGPAFTEGFYTLTYNKLTKEVSLVAYTGSFCGTIAGKEGPGPEPPTPGTSDLYLVNGDGSAASMELVNGTKFITKDGNVAGSTFVFAEKLTEAGAIDWSGKVYGMKGGVISEISEGGDYIARDPVYDVYGKTPWKVYFDTAKKELTYQEGIAKTGMGDMGDGTLVIWVLPLPHNCEFFVDGFDKALSKMVNLAVFDNIDDSKGTARYIGYSENYETYYRKDQGWLILTNNICKQQLLLIGKNASFGQEPYTEYPIIETDIPRTPGQTLPLNRLNEDEYSSYIYMADDASFQVYTNYAWGALNNTWESDTPNLVTRENFYAKLGTDFVPGLYQITFNMNTNKVKLEVVEPEPPTPLNTLYLVNGDGSTDEMVLVEGKKFITKDGNAVGSTFVFAEKLTEAGAIDWSGRVYGMKKGAISQISEGGDYISRDPIYDVYGKTPWKVYFDADAKEVIYQEGVAKSGMGDMGDGTLVIWVLPLPHNCEFFVDGFDKNLSEMVNLAVFDNIDDTKGTARYIGYGENYETYYRKDQGWLILTNNICKQQMLMIGKNASFGQSPYTEYPIIETDIPRTPGQTLPLNRLTEDTYSSYIYMADDASFQIYTNYAWGALNNTWESTTPNLVTRENFYAKLGTDFVPGLYQVTFNNTTNEVTLVSK